MKLYCQATFENFVNTITKERYLTNEFGVYLTTLEVDEGLASYKIEKYDAKQGKYITYIDWTKIDLEKKRFAITDNWLIISSRGNLKC